MPGGDCPCIVGVTVAGIVIMVTVGVALHVTSSLREPTVVRDNLRDQRIINWPDWTALCSTYSIQTYPASRAAAYFDLWQFTTEDPSSRIYPSKTVQNLTGTGSLSTGMYIGYFFHFLKTTSLDVTLTSKDISHNSSMELYLFQTMDKFNEWTNGKSPAKATSSDTRRNSTCTKKFDITDTDDYIIVAYNNCPRKQKNDVRDYQINFRIRRAQYTDVRDTTGGRIASVQQRKEVSSPDGWYILTLPEDNNPPPEGEGPLESTQIKIKCEVTNTLVFFALFAMVPFVLLMIIGCITWKIQFKASADYFNDEERRRLLVATTT